MIRELVAERERLAAHTVEAILRADWDAAGQYARQCAQLDRAITRELTRDPVEDPRPVPWLTMPEWPSATE